MLNFFLSTFVPALGVVLTAALLIYGVYYRWVDVPQKWLLTREALVAQHFTPSDHTSRCGWKGTATYLNVVDGKGNVNANAAWIYETPMEGAKQIKARVAFWKGVEVAKL